MRLDPDDDDIRRHNSVYLGPPGYTLPVRATYAQYGLYTAATAVGVAVGAATGSSLIGCWVIGFSWIAARFIWRGVDPDKPVRKVIKTVAVDWRRTRPNPDTTISDEPVRYRVTAVRYSTSQTARPRRQVGGRR